MKAVLETLQSYLGLFCEDRKPEQGHAGDAGYGGFGFPLLIRGSKPKKAQYGDDSDSDKPLFCKGPSSRVNSLSTMTNLVNSELSVSPSHCYLPQVHSNSAPERVGSTPRICNQSMGLTDCLTKMCSRRVAARRHVDEPFDKCTTEYYSCGKKGVHSRRLACELSLDMGNVDDLDVDVQTQSSMGSDTEASNVSCVEGNDSKQGAWQARQCGVSCLAGKEGCSDYVEHGKVRGLSIILTEDKLFINDPCDCVPETSPMLAGTGINRNGDVIMNKMGDFSSISIENGALVQDFIGDCEVGFCPEQGLDEGASSLEVSTYALSSSPASGCYRKKFPPPLNSLAMQSYCGKRGQSPGACGAGYCLRSFRRDGRFVLQEVKAPTHKYFRVLREDGRLKLELINVGSDSSSEEDETSVSEICVGVDTSDSVLGVVMESSHTSNLDVEDTCIGSSYASKVYAEDTCLESSNIGERVLSDQTKARVGINAGSVRTVELLGTLGVYRGLVKPSEHVASAGDALSISEMNAEASNILCVMSAYAGSERQVELAPQANLIFTKEAVAEEMIGPFIEPPLSPRCPDIRALYNEPSSSMKSSRVLPISAF
eukprot:c8361_g1_i1 orf=228-2021(+)